MRQGTILYLNGTSSAGKSSLARAIQMASTDPYLHLGVDTLFGAMSPRFHQYGLAQEIEERAPESVNGTRWITDDDGRILEIALGEASICMLRGLHAMTVALAMEGNNVIVDAVWFEPWVAFHAAATMVDCDAYLIGVRCPHAVAQEREDARGNRLKGLSALLAEKAHEAAMYDLEVDTGVHSPEQAARLVLDHIESGRTPFACRRLVEERRA